MFRYPPEMIETKIANLKSDFRHFKLLVVSNELNIIPQERSLTTIDEIDFISREFPDDIITGSIALRIYGLLNRDFSDIDIIISDPNRFSGRYLLDSYGGYENTDNRLGEITFDYKKGIFSKKRRYTVDFFENRGTSYQEVGIVPRLKVQDPIEILTYKMSMAEKGNRKHITDLEQIFSNFQYLERKGLLQTYGVLFGDIQ